MTHLLHTYGLAIVFLLVGVESAGVPVPGETTLIAAAVLSSQGRWPIEYVIAAAAAGAIVGDNLGYWLGRSGGRRILHRVPPVERALPRAERFFDKHGPKAVFIGRFVAVLRITVAWAAGISEMPWWKFFAWNAAGGIAWATSVGLVAYFLGKAAAQAISRYGLYGAAAAAGLAVLVYLGVRLWRRRTADLL